jgi:probable phosphoglycerate mutase
MIRVVLWRHGRTEWNATDRFQGQTDTDLDETGAAQAVAAAPRLAAYEPCLLVASDLRRAVRTAEALAALTGLAVERDARLRERNFGPWQGLTMDEIRERFPDDFARWGTTAPLGDPGIESVEDMGKRVLAAVRDVTDRLPEGGTAVIATHGGSARVACGALLGWPPAVWPTLGALGNCRLSELRYTPVRGWRLVAHNIA